MIVGFDRMSVLFTSTEVNALINFQGPLLS